MPVRWLKAPLVFLATLWVATFGMLAAVQQRFLYVPSHDGRTPAQVSLPAVSPSNLMTPDGAALALWSAPARAGLPTILYFHGNGGALTHRRDVFELLLREGYGLFAFSYRGFSGSTGQPSERANIADAVFAYDSLRQRGVAARDIVIYGESLGTGVAIQVAAQREAAAVILDSPYSSIAEVAASRFWVYPTDWVLRDRYDSIRHVPGVSQPILLLAGAADPIIPVQLARRLAAAITGEKRYIEYPRGGHIDHIFHAGIEEVRVWVKTHHRTGHARTD
jgi:fermentation-respiration switch protein FrsA (DUF1100 family)